jgi:hypothetical protein
MTVQKHENDRRRFPFFFFQYTSEFIVQSASYLTFYRNSARKAPVNTQGCKVVVFFITPTGGRE